MQSPGTIYAYLAMNLRDPILKDVRVRRAIAYAINVRAHHSLPVARRGAPRLQRAAAAALGLRWRRCERYPHDPERARQLLDDAGYRPNNGVRFHLTMKTSTDESTRLLAAVLQQQLREVGIALDIRTFEFATFFSDVTKGAYQIHSLRWVGGNLDPDIFEHIFGYRQLRSQARQSHLLLQPARGRIDPRGAQHGRQQKRKAIYDEIQQILADDLPYINLWYLDNVLVHTNRVHGIELSPAGSYDFLRTAELAH